MRRMPPSHSHGFTLIEILITVALVALLASAALPMTELTVKRTREQELRTALWEIRTALDAYRQAVEEGRIAGRPGASGYPGSLEELVAGVDDAKSPQPRKIYFLRRLPRDPMVNDPQLAAMDTWGLRSYASPPDDPQPGEDVFDVYSRSPGIGLNGIPYREW